MNKLSNLIWYTGNKVAGLPFYLAGFGAAKEIKGGTSAALQGAYQLPLDALTGIISNEGAWSFTKGATKVMLGMGQSAIENPLETLIAVGTGIVAGKAIGLVSERKRQFKRDEGKFKAKYGIE
tara:strand:+ start:478 stop:846 length:369 start_codon:yes stop_codon:yes gene_type:complete